MARVDALLSQLRAAAVPGRAEQEKRYVKSDRVHLGTSLPSIRKVAVGLARAEPDLPRKELLALCDALWSTGIHEACALVVELLDVLQQRLEARDLAAIERWLRDSRTWALVDSLAASVAGPLVERNPSLQRTLDRWAADPDFWMRRSALLALLLPLRQGRGDLARFGALAEPMLGDTEFFIRKAIGWVLRDTSRRRPAEVAAWLLPRAARASGLTVREATKHLPGRARAAILAAHGKAPRPRGASPRGARQRARGRGPRGSTPGV